MTRHPELPSELIPLAIRGERAAVAALVEAFLPRVYGLCLRMTRRRDAADEATQETFVRVLRSLGKLRDPERLASWVLTIAANVVRELARKRRDDAPLDWEPEARPDDAEPDPRADRRRAVDHAVASLDRDDRELFLLHCREGVALAAIAAERDASVSAVKSKIHRIRSRVRRRSLSWLEKQGASS